MKTATEQAFETAVDTGVVRPIGMTELTSALSDVRSTTSSWFETARNIVIFANQTGMYDELSAYMRARKLL